MTHIQNLLSVDDTLKALPVPKSRQWLVAFLHRNPTDPNGLPLYRLAGRDKLVCSTMPLKIVASRNKKTKSLYIRGSYLGVAVDKSCRTDRRSVARELLRRLERAIERGEYPTRELPCNKDEKTFLSEANAYMEAGRRTRYVASLIRHFGETSLAEINQDVIDRAAIVICPNAAQVVHQLFFSPHH